METYFESYDVCLDRLFSAYDQVDIRYNHKMNMLNLYGESSDSSYLLESKEEKDEQKISLLKKIIEGLRKLYRSILDKINSFLNKFKKNEEIDVKAIDAGEKISAIKKWRQNVNSSLSELKSGFKNKDAKEGMKGAGKLLKTIGIPAALLATSTVVIMKLSKHKKQVENLNNEVEAVDSLLGKFSNFISTHLGDLGAKILKGFRDIGDNIRNTADNLLHSKEIKQDKAEFNDLARGYKVSKMMEDIKQKHFDKFDASNVSELNKNLNQERKDIDNLDKEIYGKFKNAHSRKERKEAIERLRETFKHEYPEKYNKHMKHKNEMDKLNREMYKLNHKYNKL